MAFGRPGTYVRPQPTVRRLVGYFTVYLALAGLLAAGLIVDLDVVQMLRDPQAQTGRVDTHPWVGAISMIGVMLLAGAAGCCAIAAWVCHASGRRRDGQFLSATGALLALLALDDGLVGHDHLGPRFLGDSSEWLIIGALALLGVAWVAVFRDRLLSSDGLPVALIALCFAASVLIDFAVESQRRSVQVAEDGFKLAGIVTFAHAATYWSRTILRPIAAACGAPATVGEGPPG